MDPADTPLDAEADAAKPVAPWRYLVPNALTSASLVIGLGVIVIASSGDFEGAGWLIVWCVLLDKLDGTFARLLGSTSKFGVQLDSLADMVVFGVSPVAAVFLMIHGQPEQFELWDRWSWGLYAALACFPVCAGLRLAKFNVAAEDEGGPQIFFGMPTTLAGGLIGLFLLIGLKYELHGLLVALPFIAFGFGLMMVSPLPLPKVGKRESKPAQIFEAVNLVVAYVCGFARILPEYLLALTLGYAVAGFVWGLLHYNELRSGGSGGSGDSGDDEHLDLEPQPG